MMLIVNYYFQCFFKKRQSPTTICSVCFCRNYRKRLFPTISIAGANDNRPQSFAQVTKKLIQNSKKRNDIVRRVSVTEFSFSSQFSKVYISQTFGLNPSIFFLICCLTPKVLFDFLQFIQSLTFSHSHIFLFSALHFQRITYSWQQGAITQYSHMKVKI